MENVTNYRRIVIQRDVHYVRYDRWGNETEYPDGYEISGKWEVREEVDGGSEWVSCCVTLGEAKSGWNPEDVIEIDRSHPNG